MHHHEVIILDWSQFEALWYSQKAAHAAYAQELDEFRRLGRMTWVRLLSLDIALRLLSFMLLLPMGMVLTAPVASLVFHTPVDTVLRTLGWSMAGGIVLFAVYALAHYHASVYATHYVDAVIAVQDDLTAIRRSLLGLRRFYELG